MLDVVVVGAGSAGAATGLAFARAGRSVAIVDKRPLGASGARWVNLVPRWLFEEAGIRAPSGAELWNHHPGTFVMIAPGEQSSVRVRAGDRFFHVDMRALTERLLNDARAAGATLITAHVTGVLSEGARVIGVTTDSSARGEPLRAKLVVDASGIGGTVRSRINHVDDWSTPPPEDRCVAAQYQFEVDDREPLRKLLAKHHAQPGDDLAFTGTSGGYSTLNFATLADLSQVGILAGSIPAMGVADGARMIEALRRRAPWLGQRTFGGQAAIPLRRPFRTLVTPGLALVGDAACQVYSSHGSGVGMGLVAARTLADAVASSEDPGHARALARYEARFHRERGGMLAASDAFRRFSQRLTERDTEALVASKLIDEEMFARVMEQRPNRPSGAEIARILSRVARAPRAAATFAPMAARSLLLDRFGGLVRGARLAPLLEWLVGQTPPPAPHESVS